MHEPGFLLCNTVQLINSSCTNSLKYARYIVGKRPCSPNPWNGRKGDKKVMCERRSYCKKWFLLQKWMWYVSRGFSTRLVGGPVVVARSVCERRGDKRRLCERRRMWKMNSPWKTDGVCKSWIHSSVSRRPCRSRSTSGSQHAIFANRRSRSELVPKFQGI